MPTLKMFPLYEAISLHTEFCVMACTTEYWTAAHAPFKVLKFLKLYHTTRVNSQNLCPNTWRGLTSTKIHGIHSLDFSSCKLSGCLAEDTGDQLLLKLLIHWPASTTKSYNDYHWKFQRCLSCQWTSLNQPMLQWTLAKKYEASPVTSWGFSDNWSLAVLWPILSLSEMQNHEKKSRF